MTNESMYGIFRQVLSNLPEGAWVYDGDIEALGYIPGFIDPEDDRDAVTQLNANYQHGGGWIDSVSKWTFDGKLTSALDPDMPLRMIGATKLRDELVMVFQSAYVIVVQPDNTFRVARMD